MNYSNSKHISHKWQKFAILNYFNYKKKLINLLKTFDDDIEQLSSEIIKDDEELRIKQEKEMQDANLKRLQLDLIVNRHIDEINKFNNQSEEKLIKLIAIKRETYLQNLENIFQEFFENIRSNNIIYNSENKLIQIKLKKAELDQNFFDNIIPSNNINIGNNNNNNFTSTVISNYINCDPNSNLMNINPLGKIKLQ